MDVISTLISTCFNGTRAYVYIWLSKRHRVLYIGQTYGGEGTLGRAVQHVSRFGTFRVRFEEEVGLPLENADDLVLLSFDLPSDSLYLTSASTYRESVEYLVQVGLWEARVECKPTFTIISRTRTSPRVSDKTVQRIAQHIVKMFLDTYNKLPKPLALNVQK